MDKKEVDGTLRFYLKMLWMPLLALIAIDVIAFMTMRLNLLGIKSYAYSLFFGLLISCLIAWYIGYITVKKYSNNFMTSAVTGAAAGAISGLVMGTLEIMSVALQHGIMKISSPDVFTLLIQLPIIAAIAGGVIAVVGGIWATGYYKH
jgi:hypothetical protein